MRATRRALRATVIAVALLASTAWAEERHGVPVYPGARPDPVAAAAASEGGKVDAACHRTDDVVPQVTTYYRNQPGCEVVSERDEHGVLRVGAVEVTVRLVPAEGKAGSAGRQTLVCILRRR